MFDLNLFQKQVDAYKNDNDCDALIKYLEDTNRQLLIEPLPFTFVCSCELGTKADNYDEQIADWTRERNYRMALLEYEFGNVSKEQGKDDEARSHYDKAISVLKGSGLTDKPLYSKLAEL